MNRPAEWSKIEIKHLMIELLETELDQDLSNLTSRLDVDITCDTAVDSLNMVNIVADLEDALDIEIADGDIIPERMRSLERFADFLLGKVTASKRATKEPPLARRRAAQVRK